jgi:hypothetical protein
MNGVSGGAATATSQDYLLYGDADSDIYYADIHNCYTSTNTAPVVILGSMTLCDLRNFMTDGGADCAIATLNFSRVWLNYSQTLTCATAEEGNTVEKGVTATGHTDFRNLVKFGSGTSISQHLSATAALNFAEIAAVTTAGLTIAVSGAADGDTAIATPTGAPEGGLVWHALASTNVVYVYLTNVTAAPINPAERTWRADVWKH